jgi:hypothetical protein
MGTEPRIRVSAIPGRWLEKLVMSQEIAALADELQAASPQS